MPYHDSRSRHERRYSNTSTRSSVALSSIAPGDADLLGSRRSRPHKVWRKKFVKLIVVGDSGLGKTTLIRNLLATPEDRLEVHDGTCTSKESFLKDPEKLCSTVSWRDDEDKTEWVYRIQDTPGYGDDLDYNHTVANLTKYIEDQNRKWLKLEQNIERKSDMSEIEDPRVDACIFTVAPHRLKAVDLKVMYEISRYVPIIPVVTKADTMTVSETATYRSDICAKLSDPMLPDVRDRVNVLRFERDSLDRAGFKDHSTLYPPFFVVASNDINEELCTGYDPVLWPERKYPWGCAEAFHRDHSDLLGLRALLLREALEEIVKYKRRRYEAWRRTTLTQVKSTKRTKGIFSRSLLPVLICLYIGRRKINWPKAKKAMRGFRGAAMDALTEVAENVKDRVGSVANRLQTIGKETEDDKANAHAAPTGGGAASATGTAAAAPEAPRAHADASEESAAPIPTPAPDPSPAPEPEPPTPPAPSAAPASELAAPAPASASASASAHPKQSREEHEAAFYSKIWNLALFGGGIALFSQRMFSK